MALARLTVGFVIFAVVIFGAVFVFAAASEEPGRVDINETETIDATIGEYNSLSKSNLLGATYADDETVTNATGATMTEGTDYNWNTSDGTIQPLNTDTTTETITVQYNGTAPPQGSRESQKILPEIATLASILAVLFGALLLVGGLLVWL